MTFQHRSRVALRACLLIAGLIVTSSFLIPAGIAVTPGDLDPSFNGSGVTTTALWGGAVAYGLAQQSDGKIVLVGADNSGSHFSLARYGSTGALDPTFGPYANGTLILRFSAGAVGRAIALQSDQKIVVAGYNSSVDPLSMSCSPSFPPCYDFALARYTSAGALDSSFGLSGIRTTVITSGADRVAQVRAVAIQSDGKIVVAGYARAGGAYGFALARYTTAGILDSSFGSAGVQTTGISTVGGTYGYGVAIQSDGKIVVAGYRVASFTPEKDDIALARYTSSGVLDTTFGPYANGTITTTIGSNAVGTAVAIQGDGKIVIAGYKFASGVYNFAVVRYTPAGALDSSFGSGGVETTTIGCAACGGAAGYSVAVQTDGRIVVGGNAILPGSQSGFALARYTSSGVLDSFFGPYGNGTQTTLIGSNALGYATAVQSDGKILVAGYATVSASNRLALARYLVYGSTGLSVGCSPGTVSKGIPTTCTATISPSAATGNITWTAGASGVFSSMKCTLSSGACSVQFAPSTSTTPVNITASYSGDANYATNSKNFLLGVTPPSSDFQSPILILAITAFGCLVSTRLRKWPNGSPTNRI